MSVALSYPGVYIQEIPSGVRTITGVATSIALFIGWSRKGPTDRAVRISNFTDFERIFGGLDGASYLGYGVRQFFGNGGADAYVIRIVDETAGTGANPSKLTVDSFTVNAISPGLWGNKLRVKSTATGSAFRWDVYETRMVKGQESHVLVESLIGLSKTKTDPRYAPAIVNAQSEYISVDWPDNSAAEGEGNGDDGGAGDGGAADGDALEGGDAGDGDGGDGGGADDGAGGVGDGGGGGTPPPDPPGSALTGGLDGLALTPDQVSFQTAVTGLFEEGKRADQIDLFNIICVPGLTDQVTLATLQTKAKERRAFLVADSPKDAKVSNVAAKLPSSSDRDYSAFYFPWVRAPDPLLSQALREFPPSGFVAGVYARTDAERGVWKAPAGIDATLNGVAELTIDMSDPENGQLNPDAVNCLRTFSAYGNVVWGARTLDGDDDNPSDWKYVPLRRLALFIEESLFRGTKWVVFEPNDEPLWAQIRLNVGAFMNSLFKQGAFQGATPKDAYFVKCDKETNPQNDINRGIVNIVVGFAPLKPAEFVVITIQQMAGQIQV